MALTLPTWSAPPLPHPTSGAASYSACLAVGDILKSFHADPLATPFCSTLLHLSAATKTDIITVLSEPTTVTVVATVDATVTPTSTSYTTTFVTVSTCTAHARPNKRDPGHVGGYQPPANDYQPPNDYRLPTNYQPPHPHSYQPLPTNDYQPPTHDYQPPANNHQSLAGGYQPAYIPSQFSVADISKVCECLHLPTPTLPSFSTVTILQTITATSSVGIAIAERPIATTETVTSTTTIKACPAPTSCGNQGLEWAYYNNTDGDNDGTYSNFVPQNYKTHEARYEGITGSIGGIRFIDGSTQSFYGSPSLATKYFVLNHRGYIYAPQTGTYTFTVDSVDDVAYVWIGGDAYSGWTAPSANLKAAYTDGPGRGSCSADLVEGQYYPIRILFSQAQGAAVFQLSVTAPDETVFLSSETNNSPYLVRHSCDENVAPKYSPFGAEA